VRIAIDVTVPERAVTGVGVYARGLLNGLAGRPLDVRRWQCELDPPGRHRIRNGLRLLLWHQLEVPRRVRRDGIGVYHSACAVGPIQDACPTVLTVHDAILMSDHAHYGRVDRVYHRIFSVEAARRAAAVIVPTACAREEVARRYRVAPGRLHLVPHGLADAFHPCGAAEHARVRAQYGLASPFVLCVGAATPRKNGARLVDAFARALARRRDSSVELVFAGPPGPADADVDAAAARGDVQTRVRRLGIVPQRDLPGLYGAAACLAYPSVLEGFGLPILEAMACGTPVLTSHGGATGEVAADAAMLVDPLDVQSMTDGLLAVLYDDALRREVVSRGQDRARGFSWARTAELTERVYRSLAD
jgi:glycosyltransferase involved in cell wall biosynthesis